jgi:hypothetical protein
MALIPLSYGFDDRRIIKTIRATARPQTRIQRHQGSHGLAFPREGDPTKAVGSRSERCCGHACAN